MVNGRFGLLNNSPSARLVRQSGEGMFLIYTKVPDWFWVFKANISFSLIMLDILEIPVLFGDLCAEPPSTNKRDKKNWS